MEKIIKFLTKELPENAMDIQACIDLLSQSIGECKDSISQICSNAITNKDYNKIRELPDLLEVIDRIQDDLDNLSNMLQVDDEVEEKIVDKESESQGAEIPDYESLKVDPTVPYSLYDSFTYKRPIGFELYGKRYDSNDWREILIQTCEALAEQDTTLFNTFVEDKSMNGRKVSYFCKDPNSIRAPRKITGTEIYVMTHLSANAVRNVIQKMLRKYKIKIDEYKLYIKADYAARHA